MRHWGALLEPLLQGLVSDKAKERQDAWSKLKIRFDECKETGLETEHATRLMQAIARMARCELKAYFAIDETFPPKDLTALQSNKISQLLKDIKNLTKIMSGWYPNHLILNALPDFYNFSLDCLESDVLSVIHSDIFHILNSHIFAHKAYLLMLSQEQWDAFVSLFSACLSGNAVLSVALEQDICQCMFYISLIIPHRPDQWFRGCIVCLDILKDLLRAAANREHENSSWATLFRTITYLIADLKRKDAAVYEEYLRSFTDLMLSLKFAHFRTNSTICEYITFFLSHEYLDSKAALSECAKLELNKARLRPTNVDPFDMMLSMVAYICRNTKYDYPKGYVDYLMGIEFIQIFYFKSGFPELQLATNSDVLAVWTFHILSGSSVDIEATHVQGLIESASGELRNFYAAILCSLLARQLLKSDQIKSVYKQACKWLSRPGFFDASINIIFHSLLQCSDCVYDGPKFLELLELIFSSGEFMRKSTLRTVHILYGYCFRGLWWSRDSVKAYVEICRCVIKTFSTTRDTRSLLLHLASNLLELVRILGIPFRRSKHLIVSKLPYDAHSFLEMLPPTQCQFSIKEFVDFEAFLDPLQIDCFVRVYDKFCTDLKDSIMASGCVAARGAFQELTFLLVKEENFCDITMGILEFFFVSFSDHIPAVKCSRHIPLNLDGHMIFFLRGHIFSLEQSLSLLKCLVQSFESLKGSELKDHAQSSPRCQYAFWEKTPNQKLRKVREQLKTLVCFYHNLLALDKSMVDDESLFIIQDFEVYLRGNIQTFCALDSSFLSVLIEFTCKFPSGFISLAADIVKDDRYRYDDNAMRAMIAVLHNSIIGADSNLITQSAEYVIPLLWKHLKWGTSRNTKKAFLEMFHEFLMRGGKIQSDCALVQLFTDPCPDSASYCSPALVKVAADMLSLLWSTHSLVWKDLTMGSFLARIKTIGALVCAGTIDGRALWSSIVSFPLQQLNDLDSVKALQRFFSKLLGTSSKPFVINLYIQWIKSGKPFDKFPASLFGHDYRWDSLILDSSIFPEVVLRQGFEKVYHFLEKTEHPILSIAANFPSLIAIALISFFEGKESAAELILTGFLKKHLGDTEFELLFREKVFEVIGYVIQFATCPKVVQSCFKHIAGLFKCETIEELTSPAYMAQVILHKLEFCDRYFFGAKEFRDWLENVLKLCPTLFTNSILTGKIYGCLLHTLESAPFPPCPDYRHLMYFALHSTFQNSLDDESDQIHRSLMKHLALYSSYDSIAEHLIPEVLGQMSEYRCSSFDLIGKYLLSKDCVGSPCLVKDELVAVFLRNCKNVMLCERLVTLLFESKCLQPLMSLEIKTTLLNQFEPRSIKDYGRMKCEILYQASKVANNTGDLEQTIASGNIVRDVLEIIQANLQKSSVFGFRLLLSSISQIISSDSVCNEGLWIALPSNMRQKIEFLRVERKRKRLIFPKVRKSGSIVYASLWNSSLDSKPEIWLASLAVCLIENHSRNPLFQKLALGCNPINSAFCRSLVHFLLEDAMSNNENEDFIGPIREFLRTQIFPENSLHVTMMAVIADCVKYLLIQRPISSLLIDYKLLASILSHFLFPPLEVLFFFEMGLPQTISSEARHILSRLYMDLSASDYEDAFCQGSVSFPQLCLPQVASVKSLEEVATSALWQLQKWDIDVIPDDLRLNGDMIDIFNCIKDLDYGIDVAERLGKINCIGARLELDFKDAQKIQALRKCSIGSLAAIQIDETPVDGVNIALLSLTTRRSELCSSIVGLLGSLPRRLSSLFLFNSNHVENIIKSYDENGDSEAVVDLSLILKGEQAKYLWDIGQKESAIKLIQEGLQNIPNCPIHDVFIREYAALSYAQAAEWIFESKSVLPLAIKETYLDASLKTIGGFPSNPKTLAKIYSTYAKFVDYLFDQMSNSENLDFREKLLIQARQDIEALTKMASTRRDDPNVKNTLRQLEQQYQMDFKEFKEIERNRTSFLLLTIENYLRCLQLVEAYDLCVFRVCALWLQHYTKVPDLTRLISSALGKVACHKFLPLIYQLAARAEVTDSSKGPEFQSFQDTLEKLLARMASKHPYHCVYQILALKTGATMKAAPSKRRLVVTDTLDDRRAAAAARIVSKLKSTDSRVGQIVDSIEKVCMAYIELADYELPPDTKPNVVIPFDSKWLIQRLANNHYSKIAIPTKTIRVDPTGQYFDIVTIGGFGEGFKVVGGINLPKIIDCLGSDGVNYRQLVKGKDDVRQDAVMEQVFVLVNQLLKANESTRLRNLSVRTYRIIPLHALAGLLEWVSHTIPLGDYLMPAHERINPSDLTVRQCRSLLKAEFDDAASTPTSKLRTFKKLIGRFNPVLRHFFWETALSPADWWARRSAYVSSCAATSMLGYIVGLGDRHCQNILLDRCTGELIHIDLNMIFEMGKNLRIPERVPFRLTRDIVDGLGPAGTKGGFERGAEETLKLLRSEWETILMILEVFKFDPLYKWNLKYHFPVHGRVTIFSPIKAARRLAGQGQVADNFGLLGNSSSHQDSHINDPNSDSSSNAQPEADRVLLRIKEKLLGFVEGTQLSERGQVQYLIQQATSIEAMAQMYPGWSPYM